MRFSPAPALKPDVDANHKPMLRGVVDEMSLRMVDLERPLSRKT
jgi:hypothetical protein